MTTGNADLPQLQREQCWKPGLSAASSVYVESGVWIRRSKNLPSFGGGGKREARGWFSRTRVAPRIKERCAALAVASRHLGTPPLASRASPPSKGGELCYRRSLLPSTIW